MNALRPFSSASLILAFSLSYAVGQTEENRDADVSSGKPKVNAEDGGAAVDLAEVREMTVAQTNAFREAEGLPSLATNEHLQKAARYFADFMTRENVYGHYADGQRPAVRASNHGYDYCIVTENLAYAFRSDGFTKDELTETFVEGWKESEGHRKNMLGKYVTETAVAVSRSEDTGHYVAVQLFGRPRSASVAFRLENASDADASYVIVHDEEEQEFRLPPGMIRTHEMCRPGAIRFAWMEDPREVKDETRYVLNREGDAYSLEAQEEPGIGDTFSEESAEESAEESTGDGGGGQ